MANIPIEKKTSTAWWAWLLGLVLLVGAGWVVLELIEEDDDDDQPLTEYVAPMEDPSPVVDIGPITAFAMLVDVENPDPLAGRAVELSDLRVTSVIGDSTFYVTPENASSDRRFFVVLDEQKTPGQPGIEGRYDVTAGQILTLYGTVERLERTNPDVWGITGAEAQKMRDDKVYLRAERLDIR